MSTARRGHLTVRACGKHRHPFYATRRARRGPLEGAIAASGPSIAALLSWIATAAHGLRMQGRKRVSGLSGDAHATNERLVERLRLEHYW